MNSYKIKFLVLLILANLISACAPQPNPTSVSTPQPTITPSPTNTIIPSSTPTPQSTNTPSPPLISDETIYYLWGSGTTDPYLVWGAQLRDKMHGECQGFICDGEDLRLYGSEVWKYLGRGEFGKKVFSFSEPLDTFVITFSGRMGFDALSGMTTDGETVSYGFLADGRVTTSYMDTSNFSMNTIGNAEDTFTAVFEPCGMIDPNPDGDNSYNMSKGSGGIVFNFLDRAWGNSPYKTRKGYSLNSLTIVSAPASSITSDMICP